MAVVYYDKYSGNFLAGIGCNLYQLQGAQSKHLLTCGKVPTTCQNYGKTDKKVEGVAFIGDIASSEQSVVVINNNKVVEVFGRDFKDATASTVVTKRPTSVQVTSSKVLISDKSGDAYSYDLDLSNQSYLLGHVSVILDMVITEDNKLLVTCDRDEKIRVSHFPNCYNVATYLLHHSEYVLRVLLLSENLLLSLGGDNQMVLWDLQNAVPLQTIKLENGYYSGVTFSSPFLISSSCVTKSDHVTSTENHVTSTKDLVTIYRLTDSTLTQISEVTLSHAIISCAASNGEILILTSEPNLLLFDLLDGSLTNKRVVQGDHDFKSLVLPVQPDSTKVSRTAGFTEYFERKRKRIEEENLKEDVKTLQVKS